MRSIFILALAVLLGWPVVTGFRTGQVHLRGGSTIKRKDKPFLYWSSLAVGAVFTLTLIAFGLGLFPIQLPSR